MLKARLSRKAFLLRFVCLLLLSGVLATYPYIVAAFSDPISEPAFTPADEHFIQVVSRIVLFIGTAVTAIPRFHDVGKSGWWSAWICLPIVGIFAIVLYCGSVCGDRCNNDYGPNPSRQNGA